MDCSQSDTGSVVNVTTLVDAERWTAAQCREYLRYAPEPTHDMGRVNYFRVCELRTRVRTRLASMQLAELWPVDPRD